MAKERVFELIRNEEVVLFIGAGMSISAGYPSGAKLAEILHEGLTDELKSDIPLNYDLSKLTEEICNMKGGNKNYLFSSLKKVFQKTPTSTETHQLLAKIPHFKNIITTNYDTLIESTNKKNIEVIRKSADYSIADPKKTLLFKIHSDLTDTENIILTTSDYINYFSKAKENTVFWNAVRDRLASNHILFIGYGMEDSNINVLLDKIIEELGSNRKEIFFVSPSITPAKLKYFQRLGIEYIESTGEKLISEIHEDLRLNYFTNLSKGIGVAGTALDFANANQISITLDKKEEKIGISNIKSLNENQNHKIEVKFELPKNETTEIILNSLNGKNFDDIHINHTEFTELNFFFNDFRFKTKEDIAKLIVKKLPFYDFKIHIIFDDDFEIDNYPFKLYCINPNENEFHIKIELDDFNLIIKIEFKTTEDETKYNVEIIPSNEITSTMSGLRFYQILSRIVSNQKFKIYHDNKLLYNYSPKLIFDENTFDAKLLLKYFENLKKIEKHFEVRFSKISLNKAFEKSIEKIISYIDQKSFPQKFDGHPFKIEDKNEFDKFVQAGNDERVLIMSENKKTIVELYDYKFEIGYLHNIIYNIVVENWENMKFNKENEIIMKSKDNLIYLQYSDNKTLIVNSPKPKKK